MSHALLHRKQPNNLHAQERLVSNYNVRLSRFARIVGTTLAAPYFDPNPCGSRISNDDLIITITTRQVKEAQVHILPTCSWQSVQSGSFIRIYIISTVKISLVCGIMPCGLVAANRRFGFIYSDKKAENLHKMSINFDNITLRQVLHSPHCAALKNDVTCLFYFLYGSQRTPPPPEIV